MKTGKPRCDYLKQDPPIPGQNVALVSMVKPRNANAVRNKEIFLAAHFIQNFVKNYIDQKLFEWSDDPHKNKDVDEDLAREKIDLSMENISARYHDFIEHQSGPLDEQYEIDHNKKSDLIVTGFKVRGVFPNDDVIKEKVEELHKLEPYVDIGVAPVGMWVPFCPDHMHNVPEIYAQEKLNDIMQNNHNDHERKKKEFIAFQEKVKANKHCIDKLRPYYKSRKAEVKEDEDN